MTICARAARVALALLLLVCSVSSFASAGTAAALSLHERDGVAARGEIWAESGDRDLGFFRTEYRLVQGYRDEELDWNIGTNTIDVLSELTWEDLRSTYTRLEATLLLPRGLYLRGHVQHGWIRSGSNQDSDFLTSGRSNESSRSNNEADGGGFSDVSAGLGFRGPPVRLMHETYQFGLVLGYAYSEQNLVVRDGSQTIPLLGPFPGLRSKYDARWFGPWLGIELIGRSPLTSLIVTGGLEYHIVYYDAVADWNLRTDLDHPESFEHDARGTGFVARLGLRKDLTERLFVELGVEWSSFSADGGDDITNFADGSQAEINLNEANWSTFSAQLSFGVGF
ncbi:MAG: TonB-dependent receptor [Myxococcota bacterium]